ncbi:MAG: FtsX-like permease family protein [Parabacteroides sp.]
MNLSFHIARRYLFSKKSHNAINIISMVSVCGVVVATTALVCALSVFNGFTNIVASMFSNFDPVLKITPRYGKVLDPTAAAIQKVKKLPEVSIFCEVLQDNALVRYRDRQTVATVKGVDNNFRYLARIDSVIIDGRFMLSDSIANYATLGAGLAVQLGLRANFMDPVEIYVPKRDEKINLANPATAFNVEYTFAKAVYATNQQIYDEDFMIISLDVARSLFRYDKEASAIELGLHKSVNIAKTEAKIKSIVGDKYWVKNRYEQQDASYKMMQGEKWVTFLILCFILGLSLFNVIGSLSMLMIEKKEDVRTLRNMGASNRLIRKIFLYEGWMISGFGAIIGIILGLILCLLQQQYGLLKLGKTSGAFIIDAYPVYVEAADIITIFVTVVAIGFLAAWYPVHFLGKKWFK